MAVWIGPAAAAPIKAPETVRIHVFSLFHPHDLTIHPPAHGSLTVMLDGHPRTLSSEGQPLQIHQDSSTLECRIGEERFTAKNLATTQAQPFELEVPGKLRRRYLGILNLRIGASGALEPVVTMATEVAVASIVAAESPPHAPLEALKAQAIASRSFLLANLTPARTYDATDTTHDQFLRSPPGASEPSSKATRATAGLVLTWQPEPGEPDQIVAAMYSRSCSGTTRTLAQIMGQTGRPKTKGYPFYPVRCAYHTLHPETWTRVSPPAEAKTEKDRLAWNRTHGWSAIPSPPSDQNGSTIVGSGVGHGVGLCQIGAADMAEHGASTDQILAHFYPNTALKKLD